jgi:hypothetical protein
MHMPNGVAVLYGRIRVVDPPPPIIPEREGYRLGNLVPGGGAELVGIVGHGGGAPGDITLDTPTPSFSV